MDCCAIPNQMLEAGPAILALDQAIRRQQSRVAVQPEDLGSAAKEVAAEVRLAIGARSESHKEFVILRGNYLADPQPAEERRVSDDCVKPWTVSPHHLGKFEHPMKRGVTLTRAV